MYYSKKNIHQHQPSPSEASSSIVLLGTSAVTEEKVGAAWRANRPTGLKARTANMKVHNNIRVPSAIDWDKVWYGGLLPGKGASCGWYEDTVLRRKFDWQLHRLLRMSLEDQSSPVAAARMWFKKISNALSILQLLWLSFTAWKLTSFNSSFIDLGEGDNEESDWGELAGEEISEGGGVYEPSRSVIFWLLSRIL